MNLRDLRYLVAIAEFGHFGRAAEACHVSQPTLSMQLKKLEEYLGVQLVERSSRGVFLTPIGERITTKARWILAEAESILNLARAEEAPLCGSLNIGIIPTLSPYIVPWLLPALQIAFPKLKLIIHEDLTENLVERLQANRIDAALAALPLPADDLIEAPLFREPFYFAGPPNHPLAAAGAVDQAALREEKLLLLADGHCLRDQALDACGFDHAPAEDGSDFRFSSLETIRQMVAAGAGCTLLPALALKGSEGQLTVRPLAQGEHRTIGLAWRKSFRKTEDLTQLVAFIRENVPETVHPTESEGRSGELS